jgi:hypothetical protein
MAERRDVDDVRILRVDNDPGDALAVLQADELELFAGVGRLVHAAAERRALAIVRFARTDVDDVRIGRGERDVADRGDHVLVEDRRPGRPVVRRLPQTAAGEAQIVGRRVALVHRDVVDATAHVRRPDCTPGE